MAPGPEILRVALTARPLGRALCLDAVATPAGSGREVTAILASAAPPGAVGPAGETTAATLRTVAGAPLLTLTCGSDEGPVPLTLDGAAVTLDPRPARTDLFAGLDVMVALRNGETAGEAADWLAFHRRTQKLQAALIVDRAPPGPEADGFAKALCALRSRLEGLTRVLLVGLDHPLGRPGAAPESHPINAPEAPGKDRMAPPAPDPWQAPLGEGHLYEWLRRAWLAEAHAVAALDLSDLLRPDPAGATVFETARASGALALLGRHVFPWKSRDPARPGFADHGCMQFDRPRGLRRWCVVPAQMPDDRPWRAHRAGEATAEAVFYRCMGMRHRGHPVGRIVPRTSLVAAPALTDLVAREFGHAPALPRPAAPRAVAQQSPGRVAIVTTMKNEGPFILEWLAHHRAIGVDDILVYTNDCSDGTDRLLALLDRKGLVRHRTNPYRATGLKPQHAALQAAGNEPVIRDADWIVCMDVDEFINIKTGDGTLAALFAATRGANLISMTWRLFGNADIDGYEDRPVMAQFTLCAPEITRKPHQAWGFKTLFRNQGLFRKLGVHRPKGLEPGRLDEIRWVDGSGRPLPPQMYRTAWRSTPGTAGYDLVQLNHYALRSAQSFLVKRDRGRVNHVDRDQGLGYWFRMNHNAEEDLSIRRRLPAMEAERARLMADPEIAAAHAACVAAHRARIAELMAAPDPAALHAELTGDRLRRLSRMLSHFGSNVFLAGPGAIPDSVLRADPPADFFFTVPKGETRH
ncbi:glycosyl transferase family 2 [Rhodovulum viride]|uniref:Glycosyl transferase family 2 n=1 Tax=Rhodovulum viride TaxID=1231134 RepID=A0ABX9DKS4_9RHOB|nr:glycosyltransferase family 2 protein [Rhodovulum viride]RAP42999.1 glycosyl transferase family 2 [Rhodovulum viride]